MSMMHNVSRAVHDRVNPAVVKTMYCNCEGAVNALAINRDSSLAVVAGRNVFKIFGIEDERFEEKMNLRVGRNVNLNFSASDVTWNQNDDNILASAATNGSVVVWDINRTTKSKQDYVFTDHNRTVNRVRFHENEVNLLLSGSQDGSMKLFDVRKRTVTTTFVSGSSVRDVQFCPSVFSYFHFAAADENGNIQIWDMRQPDRVQKQITAHSGPVFSIDWHPEDRNWIGTAGRDKSIKVWDLQRNKLLYTIHTVASVMRIRWRPQRRYHIASSSLLVDFSINIWNIQRPYIPFASFEEHKDVTTDIVWKKEDPHMFYSCSKDCTLYQHVFKDAKRPADHVTPSGIDMNLDYTVSHAHGERTLSTDKHSSGKLSIFHKKPSRSDHFTQAYSTLHVHNCNKHETSLSMDWFRDSAQRYLLKGFSLDKLCEQNAQVAESQGRYQVAQSWRMLMVLYSQSLYTAPQFRTLSMGSNSSEKTDADKGKKDAQKSDHQDSGNNEITSGSDDDSDKEIIKENLSSIARGQPSTEWDILFDQDQLTYDSLGDFDKGLQELTLPNEAFVPRHEIKEHPNPLDSMPNGHDSPTSANESEGNMQNLQHSSRSNVDEEVLVTFSNDMNVPNLGFSNHVVDMLYFYAEQGDVQTPVCMLLVLGQKNRPQIDIATQENWFMSYIDLLGRFKLWTISNDVIKMSYLPQISMMNQQSTRIPLHCSTCNKVLSRVGWLCDRCKTVINTCALCHHPVKGQYLWCQGCSHGGHLQHMSDWFSSRKFCPAGCGHMCEFT
ncbi:WD repeat-containing protein 24 [Mizuhopecten yessoensis]|uniref:GATOR2 complex protein WDR24 n=1 Tax=Mizuhopecten yessoensis TaxID=6573 RepID=A0A210PSD5_MIZYE|nr:WD repeat-containing protein 24 [Mizuhopecten yessoensis]